MWVACGKRNESMATFMLPRVSPSSWQSSLFANINTWFTALVRKQAPLSASPSFNNMVLIMAAQHRCYYNASNYIIQLDVQMPGYMNTTESKTVWMASNTNKQEDRTKLTVQGKCFPGFYQRHLYASHSVKSFHLGRKKTKKVERCVQSCVIIPM